MLADRPNLAQIARTMFGRVRRPLCSLAIRNVNVASWPVASLNDRCLAVGGAIEVTPLGLYAHPRARECSNGAWEAPTL
jgi:hypothetical protein